MNKQSVCVNFVYFKWQQSKSTHIEGVWTWKGNINYQWLNEINNVNIRHKPNMEACWPRWLYHLSDSVHTFTMPPAVAYSILIVEASQSFEFYWYKAILWDFIVKHFFLPGRFNCRRFVVWILLPEKLANFLWLRMLFAAALFFHSYTQLNSTFDNAYCFPKCNNKRINGRQNFLAQMFCMRTWIEFCKVWQNGMYEKFKTTAAMHLAQCVCIPSDNIVNKVHCINATKVMKMKPIYKLRLFIIIDRETTVNLI